MDRKVVLIGAFDTKGPEYSFLASLIEKSGCKLITVNTGVMDDARQLHVDIPATEVALAGGSDIESLRKAARSEEHTSELQSLMRISYAVFCLKTKKQQN